MTTTGCCCYVMRTGQQKFGNLKQSLELGRAGQATWRQVVDFTYRRNNWTTVVLRCVRFAVILWKIRGKGGLEWFQQRVFLRMYKNFAAGPVAVASTSPYIQIRKMNALVVLRFFSFGVQNWARRGPSNRRVKVAERPVVDVQLTDMSENSEAVVWVIA